MSMEMYPTSFEVNIGGDDSLFAKFTAFDDESFEVELKTICDPKDIRELADKLEEALILLKEGIKS